MCLDEIVELVIKVCTNTHVCVHSVEFACELVATGLLQNERTKREIFQQVSTEYIDKNAMVLTLSLLIMASSESIDNDKPCINLFASILA